MKQIKKRGFTLVELVIVIAVIAILAAVLIPTFITVIDNANNSADVQLVANMNTVLSTKYDANATATAENLRKLMKDNGIDNFETKKEDNVILYDKTAKKFVLKNLKGATYEAEELVPMNSVVPMSEVKPLGSDSDNAYTVDYAAYSAEEILKGYIITSTGGNPLSEALNTIHNFDSTQESTTISKSIDSAITTALTHIVASTLYVGQNGEMFRLTLNGNTMSVNKAPSEPLTRVVFHEECTKLNLNTLATNVEGANLFIVLPNTLETVQEGSTGTFENVKFVGNTDIVKGAVNDENIWPDSLSDMHEKFEGEEGEKLATLARQSMFYVGETATGDFYYTNLVEALNAAGQSAELDKSGAQKTVVLTCNYAINQNITVPKGVTLEVPFGKGAEIFYSYLDLPAIEAMMPNYSEYKYDRSTYYYCGEAPGMTEEAVTNVMQGVTEFIPENGIAGEDKKQFEVTIAQNVTVTVHGTIRVGGVIGYEEVQGNNLVSPHDGQTYQGHTSGNYGQITNNGTIAVEGGKLDVWGFVKGDGSVVANGGTVYEPFVVTDFMGGTNTASFYLGADASPFREYGVVNIQCPMTINYGANLMVHCNLFASTEYHRTNAYLIATGTEQEALMKLLEEGASVASTYDPAKCIKAGIGKVSLTVSGKVETGVLSLAIDYGVVSMTVSTDTVLFPMPYNFDLTIEGYFTVKNQYTILPGASVTVNGTLEVASGAKLYVLDWMPSNTAIAGAQYPDAATLKNKGYNSFGELKVNGTMIVDVGGHAGGLISSEKQGAKLEVKAGAKVSDKDIRIGGVASDATNNVNIYTDLALRLVSAEGEITNAETGKTYTMGEVKAAQRTFSDIKKLTTEGASKETHDVAIKYCKDQGEVAALVAEKKDSEASGGGSLAYFKKQDTTAPTETQTVSGGWNS